MARTAHVLSRVLCAMALAVAGALAAAPARAANGGPPTAYGSADYRLGTADKIRVIVYEEADLGGEFQIDATGFVRLPLIGQIKAGGTTARELESGIASALAQGYLNDPRVSVEVLTYRPFYVVGQVQKPGEYPFAVGMTPASAVALAGGFSPKAIESTVYVRHQGDAAEQRIAVNDAIQLRPGDVVRVDSTTFWDVMDILSPLAGVSALRYTIP